MLRLSGGDVKGGAQALYQSLVRLKGEMLDA